jgi:hypothetical protein
MPCTGILDTSSGTVHSGRTEGWMRKFFSLTAESHIKRSVSRSAFHCTFHFLQQSSFRSLICCMTDSVDRTSDDSIQTNSVMAQYDYGSVWAPPRAPVRARAGRARGGYGSIRWEARMRRHCCCPRRCPGPQTPPTPPTLPLLLLPWHAASARAVSQQHRCQVSRNRCRLPVMLRKRTWSTTNSL